MKLKAWHRASLLIFPLILLVAACGGGRNWTESQKQGKRIYEALCDKCHVLKNPTDYSDAEWAATVPRYGSKLKLSSKEIAEVIDYLQAANNEEK